MALFSLAGGFLLKVFISLFSCLYYVWVALQSPGVIGKIEIELLVDGIKIKSAVSEGTQAWNGVMGIVLGHDRLYIQLGKILYLIVPKRAFESEQRFDEFQNYLKENIKNVGA